MVGASVVLLGSILFFIMPQGQKKAAEGKNDSNESSSQATPNAHEVNERPDHGTRECGPEPPFRNALLGQSRAGSSVDIIPLSRSSVR